MGNKAGDIMDMFYRHENIHVFKRWVYFQLLSDHRLTFEMKDENTYIIKCQHKTAIYTIWPMGIIEETIEENDKVIFYLHFTFRNFHFCTDMFKRMIDKLVEEDVKEIKILLCCSGGMTTGFFAQKMNQYCELNSLHVVVEAVPLYHLDNVIMDYDYLFVAPQLRYKLPELISKYKDVKVDSIDPATFAKYDCEKLLKNIK